MTETRTPTTDSIAIARDVLRTESEAIRALCDRIDQNFTKCIHLFLHCQGRVVVTGMGKSGHIAGKIAATLASTGTPAFFVHPGEASHGDLGMITRDDIVIAISNSGETNEVLSLLPMLKRFDITLIALTGNPQSTLAKTSHIHLDVSIEKEACPLGLAPTSSTTATLAMGDALAIATLQARGFTEEEFARSHPGGSLGKRLLLKVNDLMHVSDKIPKVHASATLSETLETMTRHGFGATSIVDDTGKMIGIFTDGDIRRAFTHIEDIHNTPIQSVMTKGGKTISADKLAAEALNIMEHSTITSLFIVDDAHHPIGIIHLHDLLRAGIA